MQDKQTHPSGSLDQYHESLIEKIKDKIHHLLDGIDTDFPLSGGDEPTLHNH
jgi:hypothetical protein